MPALDRQQVQRMDLAFFIEVLLVSNNLHFYVSEADIPHVEVVVNLLLKLSTEAEPHCEGTPQHFPVDYNIKEMHEVVVRRILGQQLHAESFLVY